MLSAQEDQFLQQWLLHGHPKGPIGAHSQLEKDKCGRVSCPTGVLWVDSCLQTKICLNLSRSHGYTEGHKAGQEHLVFYRFLQEMWLFQALFLLEINMDTGFMHVNKWQAWDKSVIQGAPVNVTSDRKQIDVRWLAPWMLSLPWGTIWWTVGTGTLWNQKLCLALYVASAQTD